MENKLIVKIEKVAQKEYETIGEETPIKDKNGVQLKVGDIVLAKFVSIFDYVPIVKRKDKYFAYGMGDIFNTDGSFANGAQIEKVKDYKDIVLGSEMLIFSSCGIKLSIQYGEKDV